MRRLKAYPENPHTSTLGECQKVECKIGKAWFRNHLVFGTKIDAVAYGEAMVDSGAAEKYRLVGTDAPPNLLEEENESTDDVNSLFSLV